MTNKLLKVFLFTILFTSVVLNGTAIYILLFKVKKKEITHLFITSISLVNLLESLVEFIPLLLLVYSDASLIERTSLCIASSFVVFGFAMSSITQQSMLSLIKIIVIKYPIFYHKTFKKMWIKAALITICYLYGFCWATFPLIGWSKYQLDIDKMRCSLDWNLTHPGSFFYFLTITIFCYLLPVIVISSTFYTGNKIIYGRKVSIARQNKNNQYINILEKDYLKVSFLSVTTFLIIWTPYLVTGILATLKIVIPKQLVTTAAMFSKLSTITNTLINCFIIKSFRNHILDLKIVQCIRNKKNAAKIKPQPYYINCNYLRQT
ncbi:opsin-3 [Hydra vulgaris]|uniref:opsin-3 n=1 Tax=Hydra vulgaris TaxID=6087 RepID=UPI0006415585|nr:opsin-3-like [Hydra vulgaris]